jgi:triacylglycerol esterase/lipase EstA (alpha/beta hydrolase family)
MSPSPAAQIQAFPLIVINGLGAPRSAAILYARYFRNHGHRTFVAPQRWMYWGDVRQSACLVARQVDDAIARTGSAKVRMVGMSLGGLLGYYYLACLDGARKVECFVSVGGPLNGTAIGHLGRMPPFSLLPAIAQCRPDSEVFREIEAALPLRGPRLYSVGARGDAITPRSVWDAPGFEPVESDTGCFPVGHWMLFTHEANRRIVLNLLSPS